jgi:hypothetical protein
MKEIKLVNVGAALVLFLLSLAILQWAKLPKGVGPTAAESSLEAGQLTELPVLPQNEFIKPIAVPFIEKKLFLTEKNSSENNDEPKDLSVSSGKALL